MATTSTCFWQLSIAAWSLSLCYCPCWTQGARLSGSSSCLFWPAKNSQLRALKMPGYPPWVFITWSWGKECPLDSSGDTELGGGWASLHDEFILASSLSKPLVSSSSRFSRVLSGDPLGLLRALFSIYELKKFFHNNKTLFCLFHSYVRTRVL